jgi:hypothetical protein
MPHNENHARPHGTSPTSNSNHQLRTPTTQPGPRARNGSRVDPRQHKKCRVSAIRRCTVCAPVARRRSPAGVPVRTNARTRGRGHPLAQPTVLGSVGVTPQRARTRQRLHRCSTGGRPSLREQTGADLCAHQPPCPTAGSRDHGAVPHRPPRARPETAPERSHRLRRLRRAVARRPGGRPVGPDPPDHPRGLRPRTGPT